MKTDNICNLCHEENERDNFLCAYCGFHLDMKIDINDFGLPEINWNDMKIDIRSEKSLYIIIDKHTYYIDNSTNEQIVTIFKNKKEWNILRN